MERLAGIDAAFLYMETPSVHMHVVGVVTLDPATAPAPWSAETAGLHLAARLASMPRFRSRLVAVPLGLGHPFWMEEPGFDPAERVRHATVEAPGGERELAALAGRVASRPLDRSRPLWELWMAEGLTGGRVALIFKIHHALVDGSSGMDVMGRLFDLEPGPCEAPAPAAASAVAEAVPSLLALAGDALGGAIGGPLRLARLLAETGRQALTVLPEMAADALRGGGPTLPFNAPQVPLSRALTPERAMAFGRAPLADVKRVKEAFSVTVNDVVLTACTMALRRYLEACDALPSRPLIASVPVAVRGEPRRESANHVSAMFVALPVELDDPIEQLRAIHNDTAAAKRAHAAFGGHMLGEWVELAPPLLFAGGARLYSSLHLADSLRPVHNLVISNVAGPSAPFYAAGAEVCSLYPMGPLLEGAAVNVSVLSYRDCLDFGVVVCPGVVGDPWRIADGFGAAVDELLALSRKRPSAESRRTSGAARRVGPARRAGAA